MSEFNYGFDLDDNLLELIRDFEDIPDRMNIFLPHMSCSCGNRQIASSYLPFLRRINPNNENSMTPSEAMDSLNILYGCCRGNLVTSLSLNLVNYYYDPHKASAGDTKRYPIDWRKLGAEEQKIPEKNIYESKGSNFIIDQYGNIIDKDTKIKTYITVPKEHDTLGRTSIIPVVSEPIIISDIGVKDAWKTSFRHGEELIGQNEALTKAIERLDLITITSLLEKGVKPTDDDRKIISDKMKSYDYDPSNKIGKKINDINSLLNTKKRK